MINLFVFSLLVSVTDASTVKKSEAIITNVYLCATPPCGSTKSVVEATTPSPGKKVVKSGKKKGVPRLVKGVAAMTGIYTGLALGGVALYKGASSLRGSRQAPSRDEDSSNPEFSSDERKKGNNQAFSNPNNNYDYSYQACYSCQGYYHQYSS